VLWVDDSSYLRSCYYVAFWVFTQVVSAPVAPHNTQHAQTSKINGCSSLANDEVCSYQLLADFSFI